MGREDKYRERGKQDGERSEWDLLCIPDTCEARFGYNVI